MIWIFELYQISHLVFSFYLAHVLNMDILMEPDIDKSMVDINL